MINLWQVNDHWHLTFDTKDIDSGEGLRYTWRKMTPSCTSLVILLVLIVLIIHNICIDFLPIIEPFVLTQYLYWFSNIFWMITNVNSLLKNIFYLKNYKKKQKKV